jgi:hypothetical protein
MELIYLPTQLAPELTARNTRCPDGASGPCSLERLVIFDVPATWTQPVWSDRAWRG